MKRHILFILTLLLFFHAKSQPNCIFTHYSSENGLSQNSIMSMVQDHNGVLWFSTWDGINRFNGYDFKVYKARQGNKITMTNNRVDLLEVDPYNYIDRAKLEPREGLMAAYDADFFLSSANAVTDDGVLVNIDGNSNRVSCIAQGPKKVIFIVGINKVCPDLDSAMKRARNVAATANAQRFDIKTPCKETGKCFDCKSPDTICCQFLITRYSRHKDRIHVILVNDTLGM